MRLAAGPAMAVSDALEGRVRLVGDGAAKAASGQHVVLRLRPGCEASRGGLRRQAQQCRNHSSTCRKNAMDQLDELAIFVPIVVEGSLARAASRLRRSPPAVTRALAALEDRIGVRLVDRTTRRLAPTEAGRAF